MGWFGASLSAVTRAATGIFTDVAPNTPGYTLLSGIFPGAVGAPPKRGTREFLDAYSRMPLLRAIVSRIAFSVASVEWQLFVVNGKNGKARGDAQIKSIQRCTDPRLRSKALMHRRHGQELKQIEGHPFLDLLDTGNNYQSGLQMKMILAASMELVGEAFWMKERTGKLVTGVWPIPAYWITGTPTPTNPFYRVSFRGWQGNIPDTEILWFQDPDPANPYWRGTGIAQSVADELETDEYAAKTTKLHFLNRAKPDILIASKDLTLDETRRLKADWLNDHQGFWNAFKPRFMNRDVQVHEFSLDLRSQQFVQIREHERNIIMHTWGIPPEILGVVENSNRATITAAEYLYARNLLVPRLELLRSILQERFLEEFDERLILDYVSPVEEDRQFALEAASAAPYTRNIDEWRELQGLEPLPEDKGKVYYLPSGQFVETYPVITEEEQQHQKEVQTAMRDANIATSQQSRDAARQGFGGENPTGGKPPSKPPGYGGRGGGTSTERGSSLSEGGQRGSSGTSLAAGPGTIKRLRVRSPDGRVGTLFLDEGEPVPPHLTVIEESIPAAALPT